MPLVSIVCSASQEFRRLLIEPLRDGNGYGSLYFGTTWNSISIEKEDSLDDNPCNANAMSIGSVRPGCDILYRGDGDGRFWTAINVMQPRRVRFKMQPLIANVRLSLMAGIPPRDANLPPALLTVVFPVDPVHTYYVWMDGVRMLPESSGYVVSANDPTGTYARGGDYELTVALRVSTTIEVRAERTLGVDINIRDFNTTAGVAEAVGPLFGISASNTVVQDGDVVTAEVSILSTRSTVHVDLISQNPMALHRVGAPVSCGDRFTNNDIRDALTFEPIDPSDFGDNEEQWYIRTLFRESTKYERGCNDPNAADYDVSATWHDPTHCHFLSSRCQAPQAGTTDTTRPTAGGAGAGHEVAKLDAEIAADVKSTLVAMVVGTLKHEAAPGPAQGQAQEDVESLLVESMLIDVAAIADFNLDDVPDRVGLMGVSVERVRLVGSVVSVDGSWRCHRATATPGLDTTIITCFEVVGRDLQVNDMLFDSLAAADAYVAQKAAQIDWLDDQPLACKVGIQHMLCGHYLQECAHTSVCASACSRAFDFCNGPGVPNDGERCSGWTSVVGDACGYEVDFVCPFNHVAYPLCTYSVRGTLLSGGASLSDCNVTLVSEEDMLSLDSAVTDNDGRFLLRHHATIPPSSAFLRVVPGNPAAGNESECRSTLTNQSLGMQLRGSTLATVISPLSTMKQALLSLGASRSSADETIIASLLGFNLGQMPAGSIGLDLDRYDVFSDMRKPECEMVWCVQLLAASMQLETLFSVGETVIGVDEVQLRSDIRYEQQQLDLANSGGAGQGNGNGTAGDILLDGIGGVASAAPDGAGGGGDGSGRRRTLETLLDSCQQGTSSDDIDQEQEEQEQREACRRSRRSLQILKDNSAEEIVFAVSHVLANKMQRAVAYSTTIDLSDTSIVLEVLREAKVVTMVETNRVIVETAATAVSGVNKQATMALLQTTGSLAAAGSVAVAPTTFADRIALLNTANTLGLLVATSITPSAVDMMAIVEPDELLASSVTFIENWPADDDVDLWAATMASAAEGVGAIPEFERPLEPEPEPEPGPEPEPTPEPEPESIEPEPEYADDSAEDGGAQMGAGGLGTGMAMILVLIGTCCVVVTGGVTAGLMWRRKLKSSQSALEPERVYEEKSWAPAEDKYAKPKRHRRSDKDNTIKAAPKGLLEVARLMTPQDGSGNGRGSPGRNGKGKGGRVSPGKKKLAKVSLSNTCSFKPDKRALP